MTLWLTVAVIGLGSYLSRLSFIAVFRRAVPPALERMLVFVAPAVLAALILPAVVLVGGQFDVSPVGNPRALAALAGGLAAWWLRSVSATVVVGMATRWVLQALG
jgi:branched-subunit amino acid transport protein